MSAFAKQRMTPKTPTSTSRRSAFQRGCKTPTSKTSIMDASTSSSASSSSQQGELPVGTDRFVPRRGTAAEQDVSRFHLQRADSTCEGENGHNSNGHSSSGSHTNKHSDGAMPPTPSKEELIQTLDEELLNSVNGSAKVLTFNQSAPRLEGSGRQHQASLYKFAAAAGAKQSGAGSVGGKSAALAAKAARARVTRVIPRTAEKILDAPNFLGDYYLNVLDWGANFVVALALDTTVYLWDAKTSEIRELMDTGDDANKIASVKWAPTESYIAIGLFNGNVEVWDAAKGARLRTIRASADGARIAALDWNRYLLTTGAKDGSVKVWDVRQPADRVLVWETQDHDQEVCGLKWRADGKRLATGGNDNLVCVYDFDDTTSRFRKRHELVNHQAAVKALAWCPWEKDTLGTGGGTEDRQVCFWNTSTGELIDSIDTGSQVSAMVWSQNPNCREFVTAHGYNTNALVVWKYPSLTKVAELTGHTERVLHMVLSPDGTTVASASPEDETLRFWKVFEPEPVKSAKTAGSSGRGASRSGMQGKRLGGNRSIR